MSRPSPLAARGVGCHWVSLYGWSVTCIPGIAPNSASRTFSMASCSGLPGVRRPNAFNRLVSCSSSPAPANVVSSTVVGHADWAPATDGNAVSDAATMAAARPLMIRCVPLPLTAPHSQPDPA